MNEIKTILVVDDMAFFLKTLKSLLQDMPYKLICVNSGKDALRFLETRCPDLFILDVEMPNMNGYELAKKIRENGQTAPILFLTGNSSPEDVQKALDAGGADVVTKPILKEYIIEKIKKYI